TRPVTASTRRRRPLPPRPFIGREPELTTALAHLQDQDCRLLSFVGAGGMGKTALALELAWRLDPDDLGGVTFVPLETATTVDAAIAMIGDGIGLTFFGPESARAQLLSALTSRRDVLLLDNLEHLPGMAELLAEILRGAAGLMLVTTSRERLGLRDEWVVEVYGLPVDGEAGSDAALLFDAAARRAHAGFDLSRDEPAVAAICRLVGGMPLALELAAGWLPTLDAADIAASLSHGLELLRAEAVDRPVRHGDVRGVLDTTWQRLGHAERTALAGLAVCVGGFSIEAARRVADVDPLLLRRLVTSSLVRRQDDGRFVQHPLLWRYARERASADADAWEAARARHAGYFATVLERVAAATHGGRNRSRPEDVADLPNVLDGWAWAAEHGRADLLARGVDGLVTIAQASQRPQEVAQAVALAVDAVVPESAVQARLLRALGELQLWSYGGRAAADSLRHSAALADRRGDRREVGLALFYLALSAAFDDHSTVDAAATWKRCIAIFREVGDQYHEARSLVNLADGVAEPLERERLLRTAVGLLRTDDGSFGPTLALHNLARTLQLAHGAWAPARALLDEAIAVEGAVGIPFRLAWWQVARVELCLDEGRLDGLDERLVEAESVAATVGSGIGSWVVDYVSLGRGRLSLARGELERALDILGRVRRGDSGHPDPYGHRSEAACWYALAALRVGRKEEAEQAAKDALGAAPTLIDAAPYEWWSRGAVAACVLGEVLTERGEMAAAADVLRSTLAVVRSLRLLPSALHLCLGAARLSAARGDTDEERSLLELAAHQSAAAAHTRNEAERRLADFASPPSAKEGDDIHLYVVLDAIDMALASMESRRFS
ncbi:MAG TPA: hypothetical protein VFD39_03125, partial [Trueperaceae bacterium]|nr:hypothetical protein [Trueperaceae bacterium]